MTKIRCFSHHRRQSPQWWITKWRNEWLNEFKKSFKQTGILGPVTSHHPLTLSFPLLPLKFIKVRAPLLTEALLLGALAWQLGRCECCRGLDIIRDDACGQNAHRVTTPASYSSLVHGLSMSRLIPRHHNPSGPLNHKEEAKDSDREIHRTRNLSEVPVFFLGSITL